MWMKLINELKTGSNVIDVQQKADEDGKVTIGDGHVPDTSHASKT